MQFEFQNLESETLSPVAGSLPWNSSALVLQVMAMDEPKGRMLRLQFPLDGPNGLVRGKIIVEKSQRIKGSFELTSICPELAVVLNNSDVVVFWACRPAFRDKSIKDGYFQAAQVKAGCILIPKTKHMRVDSRRRR